MGTEPRRYLLQAKLEELLGSENVYFNPPDSIHLSYPCIIYTVSKRDTKHADDAAYSRRIGYDITIIGVDPDSDIPNKIFDEFSYAQYNRSFTSDNLIHDVFVVYF